MKKTPRHPFAAGILIFTVLFSFILAAGVKIPLTIFKNQIEQAAGNFIHRQVSINGGLYFTLSLTPAFEFQNITIANPAGWSGAIPMFSAQSGTGQLDALSLVSGDIRVMNFTMKGVDVNLVTQADHSANYHFDRGDKAAVSGKPNLEQSRFRLTSVDNVQLEDINIIYHDELSGNSYDFGIDGAFGTARQNDALALRLRGQFVGQPLSAEISGDALAKLVHSRDCWSLRSGTLTYAGTTVSLTGNVIKEPESMTGLIDLTLAGAGLAKLGRPFGVSLPDPGEFRMRVKLSVSPAAIQASSISFESVPVKLTSDLYLSLHGDRPTLMGSVSVEHFDLDLIDMVQDEPVLKDSQESKEKGSQPPDMLSQQIPLDILQFIDADLRVKGRDLQLGTATLKEVDGLVSLIDGDLVVPVHVSMSGVSMDTQLEIMSGEEPQYSLTGGANGADLTMFMTLSRDHDNMSVKVSKLDYTLASSGRTVRDVVKNIRADIQVNDTTALSADGSMVFGADEFSVRRSADKPWEISGQGQLLGKPFSTKIVAGTLRDGQNGSVKVIQVDFEACDSQLELELVAAEPGDAFALDISATGHDLCNVLKPVEGFLGGKSDFTVTGQGKLGRKRWEINFGTIALSTLSAKAAISVHSTESGRPFMSVDVRIPSLNIDELMKANGQGDARSVKISGKKGAVLPQRGTASETDKEIARKILAVLTSEFPALNFFKVVDGDFVVQLDRLIVNGGLIADVCITTHLRDGKIVNSPFSADMGGTRMSGTVDLDLMADKPVLKWSFASSHAELSHIFSSFGLAESPDIKAENISASVAFKGSSLLEMVKSSSQEIHIQNGLWNIGSQLFSEPLVVRVDRGSYSSRTGDPTTISIAGSLNGEPLIAEISADGLLAKGTDRPVELSVKGSAGDLEVRFQGTVKRNPGGKPTIHLDTLVSGNRLANLNRLLKYDLPPIGPYKLHGAMHTTKNTLALDKLQAEVGSSSLTGDITLTVKKDEKGKLINPSVLDVRFKAPSLQLDDFQPGEWGASTAGEKARGKKGSDKASPPPGESTKGGYADLLSERFSDLIEANLEVSVEEVISGKDRLGSGYLKANNVGGKNSLESLRIEVPGGFIDMDGYYRTKDGTSEADFRLSMDRFDYGVLVRRAVPDSDIKGLMNIRIDLASSAADPRSLVKHANGKLRVGIVPENMQSGVVDLWAVNILTAALPAVMKGSESEINCIAADFTFDDGRITPDVFLLDTSRMRVQGEGFADMKDESIDFSMQPTPKSPQFFSLATPVNITGTIRDFHIGVSAGGVIGTVFRLVGSVVTVPLQKIFTKDMSADGVEACSAAMTWVVE